MIVPDHSEGGRSSASAWAHIPAIHAKGPFRTKGCLAEGGALLLGAGMEDDAITLVANASVVAASEIREDLADCLRRLDLINLAMPAIHLSMAIERLDEEIRRIAGKMEISELA